MSTLTKKITLEQFGGAIFDIAKKEAEEALTRTLYGFKESKTELKNVGVAVIKVVATQAVKGYANNTIVDVMADAYTGIQVVKGGYNLYTGINKFTKAYNECDDNKAQEVMAFLGL